MKRAVVIATLCLLALTGVARGNSYTVGTTGDSSATACGPPSTSCSLRGLIAYVGAHPFPPDTITVPPGTYTLTQSLGALVIDHDVTIAGSGANATTVAMPVPATRSTADNGPHELRVFDIGQPSGGRTPTVTISGLTVTGGTANDNTGDFGGDIRNQGSLTLADDWITNGYACSGAGVSNFEATLTIRRSLISGNSANCGGGDSGGVQNYGQPAGSGVPDLPGHLVIEDSTIANNDARLVAGVFSWGDDTNTSVIRNSTIAGNQNKDEIGPARGPGAGLGLGNGIAQVQNTIVAGNVEITGGVTTNTNCAPGPGIQSLGGNIDGARDCDFGAAGDLGNTNPLLGPLAANGGPTMTMALAAGSPARDHATSGCTASDQRGTPRPQGAACDSGAFEAFVAPANTVPPKISGTPTGGQTLVESAGSWIFGPTSFSHQWLRCDASGGACAAIAGAGGPTYTLSSSDVGKTVRVQEVASSPFGTSGPALSAPTAVIKPPALGAHLTDGFLFFRPSLTKVTKFILQNVPAGTTVVLSCKSPKHTSRSRSCAFKKKTVHVAHTTSKLSLLKSFKGRKMALKTKIEVKATKPSTIGLDDRLTTRKLKVPSESVRCLQPGAKSAGKC